MDYIDLNILQGFKRFKSTYFASIKEQQAPDKRHTSQLTFLLQ